MTNIINISYLLEAATGQQVSAELTSTLWRYVENASIERLIFGAVTCRPHISKRPSNFDEANPCRYFVRSPTFMRQFARVTEPDAFTAIASYCGAQSGGPLGEANIPILDDNGERHIFSFETFFNRYEALTLAVKHP